MTLTRPPRPDLIDACARLNAGATTAAVLVQEALAAAAAPGCRHAFLRVFDNGARAAAAAADSLRAAGAPASPLAGLAVSVKDLFDVAGFPTTAGSRTLDDVVPAAVDSLAVARLRAAGAALIGHTNLSEFAFSGVGINPHFGTPANPATLPLDAEPRIPGGSTSGGAVSVAAGAAWAALGSDTGGSIRIPAALQGLVGFKNTQALTPLQGSVPLSTSLDTACAVTLSVRDAVLVHEILAARRVRLRGRPVRALRFAVATTTLQDGLDATVARAFERSLDALRAAGAQIDEIVLPEIGELQALLAGGGLPAAESWAWHRERLARRGDDYDPRVALRIRRGGAMSAADYIDLLHARQDWIRRVDAALAPFDAVLSPTVPIVAPRIAPLLHDDAAFFAVNGALLRNTSVVNFLDGCALSLPCHAPDELPVGLMVWHSAGQDDGVLDVSLAIERLLAGRPGV
jgi:Asp-tRNA(Asn)/Glu-tRNA(Gln) amidotransferase A subunit family amidase